MVRTVLFDLGGVLVRFETERIVENFCRIVGDGPDEMREIVLGHLKAEFEDGTRSPEAFRDAIATALNCELSEEEFVPLWSDCFEANEPMLEFFGQVRQTHRTLILSNTDPYHLQWILERWPVLAECDGMALSYELGVRKPAPAFFEAANNRFALTPSQCLYIDDLPDNVQAGHTAGYQSILYEDADQVLAKIKPLLRMQE